MENERLTHQQIDEIQDIIGLALLQDGEQANEFTGLLDQVCRELQEANAVFDQVISALRELQGARERIERLVQENARLRAQLWTGHLGGEAEWGEGDA